MNNRSIITFFILLLTEISLAQSALRLPKENADKAKEMYVLLSDNYEAGNYQEAYKALLWIIEHAPDMHESVYVTGLKTIKKMIEIERSNTHLRFELMDVYDLRIMYFGNDVNVLNRKAYDAYIYLRDDPESLAKVAKIFDHLYDIEKLLLKNNLLYPYFDIKALQREKGEIDDQELILFYQNITEIIQQKSQTEESELESIQKLIDLRLGRVITLDDCTSLDKLIVNTITNENLTLRQSKLIIKLSITYGCNKEPIFFEALKVLFKNEPTVKLAKLISGIYINNKEYEEGIIYLNEALNLTTDATEKSDIYFDLSKVFYITDDKETSRKMARNSLENNPDNLAAYTHIGDLYFSSFEECKKFSSRVNDRSVFYAAYDKYSLASDLTKMSMAEQQFPSIEDIHTENYQEGQIINTNCWIGEPVQLRRRPKLVSN